jgi:predicted metal-dependent enzyme (double-stranded beta helix superfamily)
VKTSEDLGRVLGDAEFVAALQRAVREFPAYRARLPLIPYAYTRTRLISAPHYEVVAMQWAPGSVSPVHDHGTSRCWVLMVEGELAVDNYERDDDASYLTLRPAGSLRIRAGDLDHRLGPRELHRVTNPGDVSAFSLQLYAGPIETYSVVDENTRTARTVTATCDLEISI